MKLFIRFALNSCFQDDDQDKLYRRMEDLNHKLGEATILLPLVLESFRPGPASKMTIKTNCIRTWKTSTTIWGKPTSYFP